LTHGKSVGLCIMRKLADFFMFLITEAIRALIFPMKLVSLTIEAFRVSFLKRVEPGLVPSSLQ
jgi:hypothetical protein